MIVIPGPVQFLMGSPPTEEGREGGPEGRVEDEHKKRISRTFAIGAHEVTVEQFKALIPDHPHNAQYARERDAPVNVVSWYDAARYCNLLSEKENIPPSQWCYERNTKGEYAQGMKLKPNYLQLTGYRLPSEAEWEYACRAKALTSRYYGETDELLGKYAWYSKNSLNRWMLPVGSLKPNDFGLFDMQGNALEWCQERVFLYNLGKGGVPVEDREFPHTSGTLPEKAVSNESIRVLRGGSFDLPPRSVRSADRSGNRPANRFYNVGFRVARTLTTD
jgi:formylglycine-generating enzyme required for sulfatase activity